MDYSLGIIHLMTEKDKTKEVDILSINLGHESSICIVGILNGPISNMKNVMYYIENKTNNIVFKEDKSRTIDIPEIKKDDNIILNIEFKL